MSHSPHLYGYAAAVVIAYLIGAQILTVNYGSANVPRSSAAPSVIGTGSVMLAAPALAPATPAASSCDVAREVLLTGSEADITASMKALVADKTVNATARQLAHDYIGRDKASKSAQERIQFFCGL
jgi:hypothetical protein